MNDKVKNMISMLLKLYTIVPIILLAVTIFLFFNCKNKINRYNECVGTITGFYENTTENRVGSYENKAISPVISYSVNGHSYEFIGNYYSTTMKVGNEITVMYEKDDASKATIKTGLYIAPIITGSLTLLFILPISIYVILKNKGIINF